MTSIDEIISSSLLLNRFAAEGRTYQLHADEEGTKAREEVAEAERLKVDMEESEYLSQREKDAVLNDEALAALDEDAAAKYLKNAARDEAIGTEEESSSMAAQSEVEELLGASTGDEFAANSLRFDSELKEAKAEQVMRNSIAHGTHAFGFVLQSLVTAILVIYVVVMRCVFQNVVPAIKRSLSSESQFSGMDLGEKVLLLAMHFTVITGMITLLAARLSFCHIAIPSRWKAFGLLASAAGLIESTVHSLTEAYRCRINGKDATATSIAAATSFLSNAVFLVPVALMQCLTLVVVFGPKVFDQVHNTLASYQVLLWFGLLLMNALYIRVFKLKGMSSVTKPVQNKSEIGVEEGYFVGDERESLSALNINQLYQEYGSLEEITLLKSSKCSEVNTSSVSRRKRSTCCCQKFCQYCESLLLSADLLMISLVVMILYHSWPLFRILEPATKSFLGVAASLHAPILLLVVILTLSVHFMFVR